MRNILIGFLIFGCLDAICCSGFVFNKQNKLYLCASIDQAALHGYIIVNPRNIEKTSFWADNEKLIKWTSKYGSVTFSPVGCLFRFD
jgi:penicillin V acylase-like amidase (Ntn superfamily)